MEKIPTRHRILRRDTQTKSEVIAERADKDFTTDFCAAPVQWLPAGFRMAVLFIREALLGDKDSA